MHELSAETRQDLRRLHWKNVKISALIGTLSAVVTSIVENFVTAMTNSDGVDYCNPNACAGLNASAGCNSTSFVLVAGVTGGGEVLAEHCENVLRDDWGSLSADAASALLLFWLCVGGALLIATIVEILSLYYYGTVNALSLANAIDLKLLPLNRDRAFVASSLIRGEDVMLMMLPLVLPLVLLLVGADALSSISSCAGAGEREPGALRGGPVARFARLELPVRTAVRPAVQSEDRGDGLHFEGGRQALQLSRRGAVCSALDGRARGTHYFRILLLMPFNVQ